MLRIFDILLSTIGIILSTPLLLILCIIAYFDTGSPIFRQARLGRDQKPFVLLKLRTMKLNTASVATHLANKNSITAYGKFLRKTKLDELPQLWNVLFGSMSLVGPRPGLANQIELTHAREIHGVFSVRPGITGLSQIKGIDMSTPLALAKSDKEMIQSLNFYSYSKLILLTLFGAGSGDRIK